MEGVREGGIDLQHLHRLSENGREGGREGGLFRKENRGLEGGKEGRKEGGREEGMVIFMSATNNRFLSGETLMPLE